MKKFTKGFLSGAGVVAAAVTTFALGVKKTIIDPVEQKEQFVDDNRKRAMRKSRARS